MAYTGTDEDGGIGYVTDADPDLAGYLKQKVSGAVRRIVRPVASLLGRR